MNFVEGIEISCGRCLRATDVQSPNDSDSSIWNWALAFARQNSCIYNYMVKNLPSYSRSANGIAYIANGNLIPRAFAFGNNIRNIAAIVEAIVTLFN